MFPAWRWAAPLGALLCLLAVIRNSSGGVPGVGESAQHDGAATSLGVSALLERVRTRAARASPPAAFKAHPQPGAEHPSPGWAWDIAAQKRAESRTRLATKHAHEVAKEARERAQRMGDVGGRKMDLAGSDGESKADPEISPALSKELTHVISRIVSKVIRGPRCAYRRLADETCRVGVGLSALCSFFSAPALTLGGGHSRLEN